MTPADNYVPRESIKLLVDEAVEHERELRELYQEESAKALKLALDELERRLNDLNHAHQTNITDRNQFVQVAVFDAKVGPLENRVNQLDQFRVRIEEGNLIRTKDETRRQWGLGIALTFVYSVITILINYYKDHPK